MWTPKNKCVTPKNIIEEIPNLIYQKCSNDGSGDGYVVIDCVGQPLVDYDIAYYRPYFDLQAEYYGWTNCKYYKNNYSPVRLAENNFFSSLVAREDGYEQIYAGCRDEYRPVGKSVIKTSFECGHIAVSILRQQIDHNTGYPLIPDSRPHLEAIISYIATKMTKKDYFNHRDGSKSIKDDFERDWQWYCKQAINDSIMPQTIDDLQNIKDIRSYILPPNPYYNFFGNLSVEEDRKWNDPNRRNHRYTTFD